jgi:hypothetical protein
LKTARGVNEALNQAFDIAGKDAKVWTVPFGNFTLPELKVQEGGAAQTGIETAKVIS